MNPLGLADIPSLEVFEELRPRLHAAVLQHKRPRRVSVGDRVTLLFEDRETLRWQILEMCRVERTRSRAAVQEEVDVYNELIPGPGELSATLFIEITDPARIRSDLDALVGIDEHVFLEIGGERVRARFDEKQLSEDRISAVHYLRFSLTPEQIERFQEPDVPVSLVIDHPRYAAREALSDETRSSLSVDLRGDPAPLVDFSQPPEEAAPAPLRRSGRARALRPAHPLAPGHVVVEPDVASAPFLEADPELLAELLGLARELAREVVEAHGACRIVLEATSDPPRLDVFAPRRR